MTMPAANLPPEIERRVALALRMIGMGASVFPLAHGSKVPFIPKRQGGQGFKDASPDPERARTFLSNPGQLNYGVVFPEGSEIFVLDVDGGDKTQNPDWELEWARQRKELGTPGPTFTVRSQSGAWQLYFRWRTDLYGPLPAGDELCGWTLRAPWRHYVVGPGSVVNDREYVILFDGPIADFPETWVRAALAVPKPVPTITVKAGAGPAQVAVGHRHDYLRNQARHLVGVGLTGEALFAAVMDLNRKLAEPKSEEDVRRAIGEAEAKFSPDPVDERGERQAPLRVEQGPLLIQPLTDFVSTPINWLWPGWLPRGVVTLMDGNPGEGKSTLVADLVARITTCRAWPDGSGMTSPSRRVLWITTEDDPGRVIRPRVEAAGGNASRVLFVTNEVVFPSGAASFHGAVTRLAAEPDGLALVIIDPLFSHIEATVRTIADAEMRKGVMNPLGEAAEAADTCILVLRHFNKDRQSGALTHGAGSLGGIVGAARCLWTVVADPEDATHETKAVGVTKSNYAERPAPWRYRIGSVVPFGWLTGSVSCINWLGESPVDIDTLLAETKVSTEATATLRSFLWAGAQSANACAKEMRDAGFGREATDGAVKRLHVHKAKGGFDGGWQWWLPGRKTGEEAEDAEQETSSASSASSTGSAEDAGELYIQSNTHLPHLRNTTKDPPLPLVKEGRGPEDAEDAGVRGASRACARDTSGWLNPCRDYPNHQTSHRHTPSGWTCDACYPEEAR